MLTQLFLCMQKGLEFSFDGLWMLALLQDSHCIGDNCLLPLDQLVPNGTTMVTDTHKHIVKKAFIKNLVAQCLPPPQLIKLTTQYS